MLYVISSNEGVLYAVAEGSDATVIAGRIGEFGDRDGVGDNARLRPDDGIVLDGRRVVFTDSANHKLRAFDLDTRAVVTIAGQDETSRDLDMPRGVITTPNGYVVADTGHHRIVSITRPLGWRPATCRGGSTHAQCRRH
jgi:hypothetical protein